jgi:carotenoid cleavage dioxygenase-like enzyme
MGLPVQGNMPPWLTGTYIRNGPGMFQLPGQRLSHWFDAMGALHKFDFANGKVNYKSAYIECESYAWVRDHGTLKYSEFASDPCRSMFKKVMSYFIPALPNMTDNPKVNVARIAGKYMALGETQMQVEFDADTLRTVGVTEYDPKLFAYKTTAHPHFDAGHAWNVVVKFGMFSHYRIYDTSQKGAKHVTSVPVAKPAYLHGFGMSKKYFVIVAPPLVVTPIEMLFWKRPYIENHKWRPQDGTTFYVIEKSTGKLKGRFTHPAFFLFHHVNAWDEGEDLVMDINAYDDAGIVSSYYLRELEKPDLVLPKGTLRRYRLNLRTGVIQEHTISDACIELPRMDYERFNTESSYRYTYGISVHPNHPIGFYNSLVKIDTAKGTSSYWYTPDCYPGEPCFVPGPNSKCDDDGVLLSIVLDSRNGNSFLLVLDAHTLEEVARAVVPVPIVYGFHGDYFAS